MERGVPRPRLAWVAMVALLVLMGIPRRVTGQRKQLTLGLVSPPQGKLGFERVAAATTMAIDKAHEDGYITDVDVRFIWRNGNCDPKKALGVTVDLKNVQKVQGYVGLPCSLASINAGKLIAYWNLPHLSYSSVDPILADKVMYNTLVRVISPFNRMGAAALELFKYYHWARVVVVTMLDPDDYCDYIGRALEKTFSGGNITISQWIKPDFNPNIEQMRAMLQEIKVRSRIVVVCAMSDYLRDFMLTAQEEQMTGGDYVFISPTLLPPEHLDRPWVRGDGRDNEARQAYGPLLQMALGFISSPEATAFMDEIPYRMAEEPWNYNKTLESGQKGSPFALFLFDTVYLYALAADEAYRLGGTPLNGTLMFELAKRQTFEGKSGVVRFDNNGDRIGDYKLWHLPAVGGSYEGLMDIVMTSTSSDHVLINTQRDWGPSGTKSPSDTPPCGFMGELCQADTSGRDTILIVVAVLMVTLAGVVTTTVMIYRKKKFEQELELMLWKIKYDDIEFISKTSDVSKSFIRTSKASMNPSRSVSQLNGGSIGGVANTSTNFGSSSTVVSGGLMIDNPHRTISVGMYKGIVVAVKRVENTQILLTRKDHVELKVMRDLQHENLNAFVGACVDAPNICVVHNFCSKGSLQDILLNEDIKLDPNFKFSLMNDLIHAMDFLHKTPLKLHGRLKSSNCVVDGRWVLKVTDYGLETMRTSHYENDDQKYSAMLWTAPEILRGEAPSGGTQKGDVFSFAIILQEILFRTPPYEANGPVDMVAKDMIGRIRNGETTPFRPSHPADDCGDNPKVIVLMKECWREEASERPDFPAIRAAFNAISKGKRYNIMDNMLKMMEKYANNLEELVGDRTRQLADEKKKTDLLLYRMLPSMVADALKQGRTITPQLFKEVSIYFSDIVSFTVMCSKSSPMEVVDFLNDLWTVFDDVIAKYDVYKVETIGDAYMVASGVPIPNAGKHASEIANMALDILSSVMTFKIRHRPSEQLKVRIGIHSGSVVAGVVGQTMPRYCLFGDAVNTASRMESTGEALRIHLSTAACQAMNATGTKYITTKRGEIEVKGKGLQTTYWLEGKEGYSRPLPRFTD